MSGWSGLQRRRVYDENRQKILKAMTEVSAEYCKTIIELLMYLGDQDHLNYVRTPIHMANGGEYILALLHVSGPVLSLKDLAKPDNDMLSTVDQTINTIKE